MALRRGALDRPLRVLGAALFLAACLCSPVPAHAQSSDAVGRYAQMLSTVNRRIPLGQRRELAQRVLLLSTYYRIDGRLLMALVSIESAWRVEARSPAGARGLGQLMPATAAELDVDASAIDENLDGTARYLRRLLRHYRGADEARRYRFALAAYNAGPYAVARYGGVPPYSETRSYVTSVMSLFDRFRAGNADAPLPRARRAAPAAIPTFDVRLPAAGLRPVLVNVPAFVATAWNADAADRGTTTARGPFAFLRKRHAAPLPYPTIAPL